METQQNMLCSHNSILTSSCQGYCQQPRLLLGRQSVKSFAITNVPVVKQCTFLRLVAIMSVSTKTSYSAGSTTENVLSLKTRLRQFL